MFYERLPTDLHTWLIDRKLKTLAEATTFADDYIYLSEKLSRMVVEGTSFPVWWTF